MEKYSISITDCGARAGAAELQTKAIQKAIDTCFLHGGGDVIVPKGEFLTGGIRLRSGITLRLKSGAVILGSRNPEDYFSYREDSIEPLPEGDITDAPITHSIHIKDDGAEYDPDRPIYDYKRKAGSRWNNALIRAIHAHGVAIIGEEGSVIDGADCYDAQGEEHYRGPHGIHFFDCTDIYVSGYTFKNSSNWSHKLIYCSNIICDGITVLAGHDGVHMNVCENAVIRNSDFHTGDDCIAGFGNTNIIVENCLLNTACNAMRLSATNAVISKCRIYGPAEYIFRGSLTDEEKKAGVHPDNTSENGAHEYYLRAVYNFYGEFASDVPRLPGNILITDCVIENARKFMLYDFNRQLFQRFRPLDSVTFRNIKATGIEEPLSVYGDSKIPVTLVMQNVDITVADNYQADVMVYAGDFSRVELDGCKISGHNFKAVAEICTDGDCVINNLDSDIPKENYVIRATEKRNIIGC